MTANLARRTLEDPKNDATSLYWLAFLLTGRRDLSMDIAADAASETYANPFFAGWMRAWSRRTVIGTALAAIHGELATSAQRTEAARDDSPAAVPSGWTAPRDLSKADIEDALLAIDVFPRAALLLMIFEGVRMADATTLLDATPALIRKAQVIGLRQLTTNLAMKEGISSFSAASASLRLN